MLAETSPILILANATHSSQPLPWPHIVYFDEDTGREKKEKPLGPTYVWKQGVNSSE